MINYILQIILFQVLFLAIFDFFLSKETFFTKNRWYLLSTPILSFFIPLIKIPIFHKVIPEEFVIQLPEFFLNPDKVIQETITASNFNESINYISILFWIGVTVFSILFMIKLVKIINFIRKYEVKKLSEFSLIMIPNETKAFSFFNYIFLGTAIKETNREKIIQHELVHCQQKHSLDQLLFEFLKIVMWFNPMIYFYQKRITLVHEYISDAVVAKSSTKETYINNLLSNFFQVENVAFVNQFYKKSFIKKRITMMTKKQSKKMNQLKYLVLIPVLTSMLFYTSCSENFYDIENIQEKKLQTKYRIQNNKLVSFNGKKYTYLDDYLGGKPLKDMKEISFSDLTNNEKNEFNEFYKNYSNSFIYSKAPKRESFRFFKMPNGRNSYSTIIEGLYFTGKTNSEAKTEEISFMVIEKAPTFPGCEPGDKDCFSKSIQKHFARNFDADLPNTLGIEPGKKRVFIAFKIDKEGSIVDINARAPHKKIKEEVLKVMNSLPKMIPGEQGGKKIAVKYSIPFTLIVN